jgi:putative inorganic carbon (hco3(-)) transporter
VPARIPSVRTPDPAYPFSAAIALSVFSGNWSEFLPGLPLPPDRALLVLALLLVALRRLRGDGPAPSPGVGHWLLAVTVAIALASAYAAGTLGDPDARFVLLDRLGIVPFVAFAIAPLVFGGEHQRRILLATLVALGAYLGLTALFETVGPSALVYPRYILDSAVGIHFGRARGPFTDATANGIALYACAVAAAIAAASWRRRTARVAAMAVGLLCAASLVFTMQRSIWIGATLATVLTLAVVPRLRRLLVPALAAGALLVGAMLGAVPGLADRVQDRRTAQDSVWDRENLLAAAFRMVEERPLTGFGWHRFNSDSSNFLQQGDDIPLTDEGEILHNVYVSNAVELGLLGAAVWLAALVVCIGAPMVSRAPPALGVWRAGLIAIGTLWAIVALFSPLVRVFPNLILWSWAGVVAAGGLQLRSQWVRAQAARAAAGAGAASGAVRLYPKRFTRSS